MSEFEYRITGHDFVRAMLLAGYRQVRTTPMGDVVLVNGNVELAVPKREHLDEATIAALLETARMLPLTLVSLLNRLGSRDTMPEQSEVVGAKIRREK